MRLYETVEHDLPSEVVYLEHLVLDPQQDCVLLRAKSSLIHSFMKYHSKGRTKTFDGWEGTFYNVADAAYKIPRDGSVTITNFGGPILGEQNTNVGGLRVNIAWIRHVDLDKGFEMKIPGVFAMADFEDYIHGAADALRNFYLQNIRKAVLSLRMGEHFNG